MKKKILLFVALLTMLVCIFAISICAETPKSYIEFKVLLSGQNEYVTAYTNNSNLNDPTFKFDDNFYLDIDFTNLISKDDIIGLDLSEAAPVNANRQIVRFVNKASSPYKNCEEIKWFNIEGSNSTIATVMFQNWKSLKSFDLGIAKEIVDKSFNGSGLESIVIPKTVTHIKGGAFSGCLSLKSVKFEGDVTSVSGSAFSDCTALTSVDLGSSSMLGENMFYNCTSLESIVIPSTVKTINKSAFYKCTSLKSVTLGDIPYIADSMFYDCTQLSSISLPSTITEIKTNAFRNCPGITSLVIPENVTNIGHCAFYGTSITSLHIPAKVVSLGYQVAEGTPITTLTFAPNSQLKFIDHRAFQSCKSLSGTVILPDGLKEIDYGIFNACTSLKAVKIPDSVTKYTENKSMFSGCTSLEFVQLSKNVSVIPPSMFENCSSLKAISIPEGVKSISYKAIRNCKSLQAIYLPSTLTNLGEVSNFTSSDWGSFYQSTNVYFVQEPFEVFNGDTLIGESFVMPEKPDVYYMPSSIISVGNSEFQDCKNLNNVIVFPEGAVSFADCGQGAFCGTGSNRGSNPVTFVFLGDVESLIIRQNDQTYSNINFVFVNPNDKGIEDAGIIVGAANNRNQTNTYMYFCNGYASYDLSTFKAANSTKYTVKEGDFTKTTYTEEEMPHFADIRKTEKTDADCDTDAFVTTYCFCGAKIKEAYEENTALGHSHNVFLKVTYESFLSDGYYAYKCERCDDVNKDKVAPKLFVCQGYSGTEVGSKGILVGFAVNRNAIEEYKKANGNEIRYGLFAGLESRVGTNDAVNENGEAVNGAVNVEYTSRSFDIIEFKVSGISTDANKAAKLIMGVYIIDINGEEKSISYLQASEPSMDGKYSTISYNDLFPES